MEGKKLILFLSPLRENMGSYCVMPTPTIVHDSMVSISRCVLYLHITANTCFWSHGPSRALHHFPFDEETVRFKTSSESSIFSVSSPLRYLKKQKYIYVYICFHLLSIVPFSVNFAYMCMYIYFSLFFQFSSGG